MEPMSSQPRRRISAADRRQQMLDVAIELARTEGVNSLTLAHVAKASGVSKPVAYQHFGSLAGLMTAMHEQLGQEYEKNIAATLSPIEGTDPANLLRRFCETYIDCSLGAGGLYDELGSAIIAVVEEARSKRVDVAEKYAPLAVHIFDIEEEKAYQLMVAFLGAIDRTCEAVISGRIERDDAVDLLVGIFLSALP